jgi:hypothetical protein
MFMKLAKVFAALGLIAAITTITIVPEADARPRHCWRGTGGWYCN